MANAGDETETTDKPNFAKLHLGQHGPSIWRDGMEVGNPIRDGLSTFSLCFCGVG
jgi:actin-like protein 6A